MGSGWKNGGIAQRVFGRLVFACIIVLAAVGAADRAFGTVVGTSGKQPPGAQNDPGAGAGNTPGQGAAAGKTSGAPIVGTVVNIPVDKIDGRKVTAKDGTVYVIPDNVRIINETTGGGKAAVLQLEYNNGVITGAIIR